MDYATVNDIITLARPLTATEQDKAKVLLEVACAKLRVQAQKYGKNLDDMISANPDLLLAAKEIIVKAVMRALDSSSDSQPAITQGSQAAMGYSISMTYLNAGQSLYFLKNELKELGILRQKWGAIEIYDTKNSGNND